MSERLLVTSALPYVNGPAHLGHLVEYVMTDVYVRFRRSIGDDVTWICAGDAHGTPIEVNAAKAGMTPRDFGEKYRREQHQDYRRFGIEFSTFYTTDSPENARWSYRIYDALKAKGLVYKKTVEQLYCEVDARFLPDRFVRGTCPKCGTPDQYGDVCENCGTTYDPRDLVRPRCAICGSTPVVRSSDHAYVSLRSPEVFAVIRDWVEGEGHLEPGVRAQVQGWLADLQDWCITRDAPYFGFPVKDPEFAGKFLYVWVDAPIGYLSSAEHYFASEAPPDRRLSPADFERRYLAEGAPSGLEHFIGKDILRFHAVFWPAMLWATGLKRPDRMPVHGHLTVNGEKMSKSRGTFINASTYLEAGLDPELLRYFYAANLGPGASDLDLSLDEFRNRINADLSNNVANLASRTWSLLTRSGGGPPAADPEIAEATRRMLSGARAAYLALDTREVVRLLSSVASLCNKRLQDAKPWEKPTGQAERQLLGSVAGALGGIALGLQPIMPRFAAALAGSFGQPALPTWTADLDPFAAGPQAAGEKPPQIARLDAKQVAKLIVTTSIGTAPSPQPISPAAAEEREGAGLVSYDDFAKLDLRVGVVQAARAVPKADKLLELQVDVGEGSPRTIVAGIAPAYPDPGALVGKRIVVVANLEPRPLRGITSQGMLLAAGEAKDLQLVTVGGAVAPGSRVK